MHFSARCESTVAVFSILLLQTIEPTLFETSPIIFGDYIKVGAEPADRIYEDLSNIDKVKAVLGEVSTAALNGRRKRSLHVFCRIEHCTLPVFPISRV